MKIVGQTLILVLFLQALPCAQSLDQGHIEKAEQFGNAVETINKKLQNLSNSFNRQINDLQNRVSEVAVWAQELGQVMKDAKIDGAVGQPAPPVQPVPLPPSAPEPLGEPQPEIANPEEKIIKALKRLNRAQVANSRQAMDYLIGIKTVVKQPNIKWQQVKDNLKNLTQAKMYLLRFKKSFNTGVMLKKLYEGLGYTKHEQEKIPLAALSEEDNPLEHRIVRFLTRLDTQDIPTITQAMNIVINMKNEVQQPEVDWSLVQAHLNTLPRAQKELLKYKKDFNRKNWIKNLYDNITFNE